MGIQIKKWSTHEVAKNFSVNLNTVFGARLVLHTASNRIQMSGVRSRFWTLPRDESGSDSNRDYCEGKMTSSYLLASTWRVVGSIVWRGGWSEMDILRNKYIDKFEIC